MNPKVLKIELTDKCNARCVFCENRTRKNTSSLPFETFKKVVNAFPGTKIIDIQWIGESLMYPQFYDVIKYCKELGKAVTFYTNGSLIHKNTEALKLLKKGDSITISVEGRDKETYEKIRVGLSWERLVSNVKLLKEILDPEVSAKIRITNCEEIKDDIDNVVEFWKTYFDNVTFEDEYPLVRNFDTELFSNKKCTRRINHFTMNAKGDVQRCCNQRFKEGYLGNVYKEDPVVIWSNSEERTKITNRCKNCLTYEE